MRLQRMPNFAVEQPLARIRLPRLLTAGVRGMLRIDR
jgi:hypothetical protein